MRIISTLAFLSVISAHHLKTHHAKPVSLATDVPVADANKTAEAPVAAKTAPVAVVEIQKDAPAAQAEEKEMTPKSVFDAIDINKDGKLSKEEVHAGIEQIPTMTKEQKISMHVLIELNWKKADEDGSGDLDRKEFSKMISHATTPLAMIMACDKDKDGEISRLEASQCIEDNIEDEHFQEIAKKQFDNWF